MRVDSMTSTRRLFIAIPVPDILQNFFQEQQALYINSALRFIPNANLHLTVHFIG